MLLHLVNTSGHFGTSYYAPVPMCDLELSVQVDREPASAVSLATGQEVPFSYAKGVLTVQIPELELFQAIKLRL